MEYPGKITDARHHEHQVNIMYPAGKDEYKWPEKQDEIYHLVENVVRKTEPAVPTRNGLQDTLSINYFYTIDSNTLSADETYWQKSAIEKIDNFQSLLSEFDKTCGGMFQPETFSTVKIAEEWRVKYEIHFVHLSAVFKSN